MPDERIPQFLAAAAGEVLETMFFTCPMGDAEDGDYSSEEALHVRIAFNGKFSGLFGLTVDRQSAHTVASNFLGADDSEVTGEQVEDVVCELANMICGAVLSRIDSSATFEIAHPELAATMVDGNYRRSLALDDGTLTISLGL